MASESKAARVARLKKLKADILFWVTSPWRAFKAVCLGVGVLVVTTSCAGCSYVLWVYKHLPDIPHMEYAEFKERAQKSVLRRLEDKSKLPKHWLEINQVNRDYLYAVVLSEDSGFFEHDGIDIDAVRSSLAENIRSGSYEYGASTISQQVVKNVFLSQEKTLFRKLKEVFLTEQVEHRFSKNQILEVYLNIAELGPDLFGAERAAWHFFGKSPSKINAAEGAFVAQMLPSPRRNYYALFQNRNLPSSKKRRIRRVLGDMLANEFISPKQYREYTHYPFEKKFARH